MRTAALAIGATVLLTAAAAVSADALTTHPNRHHVTAGGGALQQTIIDMKPYAYWPLNGTQADAGGSDPLAAVGSGASVRHSSSNPAGASGGSVRFSPAGRQSGQYLRTTDRPAPAGTRGTLVVWFRLDRSLPGWTQTLAVDNGAATSWGAGLFINQRGRLQVADSSATVYSAAGSDPEGNNFCHRPGSCPHTATRPLNDGRWHMAAFVDQYTIGTATVTHAGWLPSLLYVDGQLVDSTIEGTLLTADGAPGARLLIGAGQRSQAGSLGKWSGNIGHVALFTRLLTAGEIDSIWQAGS